MELRLPPPLRPGARVAVVAPASPFERDELFRGLAWLATRYRLRLTGGILDRVGYLAGSDGRRADELARALSSDDVDAIVCARGGYGVMRILDTLPLDDLVRRPKWLCGFSDVTALHLAALARGVATVHGPNVTGLGRTIAPSERASFLDALEGAGARLRWSELAVVHAGPAVEGLLVGGNLALVEAMAAAGRLRIPDGAVIALEDVTERPYRIDRMLTSLLLGGHLARAAAIVFGSFTACDPARDGVTVLDVVTERTRALGVPVVSGAPFGHGAPNHSFVHGRRVRLDGTTLQAC